MSAAGALAGALNSVDEGAQLKVTGVLVQGTGYRKRIHCVCHLLIMCSTANSLAHKENQAGYSNYNGILYRMTFLFFAILFFLLIRIIRARNFPLGTVMEQYRFNSPLFREFGQTHGKLLVHLCRYKPHCLKRQMKNVGQTVYKSIAMFLIHVKAGSMILLQKVILQIYKNKKRQGKHT